MTTNTNSDQTRNVFTKQKCWFQNLRILPKTKFHFLSEVGFHQATEECLKVANLIPLVCVATLPVITGAGKSPKIPKFSISSKLRKFRLIFYLLLKTLFCDNCIIHLIRSSNITSNQTFQAIYLTSARIIIA